MAALTLYALLLAGYVLSVRSLRRQSRYMPRGYATALQPPAFVSGRATVQPLPRRQAHPEAA